MASGARRLFDSLSEYSFGGSLAIQSAIEGSAAIAACLTATVLIEVAVVNGIRSLLEPSLFSTILFSLFGFIIYLLISLAASIVPAFLAGILLAWKCHQEALFQRLTIAAGVRFGIQIGLVAGASLSVMLSPLEVWWAMHPAHSTQPPPIGSTILQAIFLALPIIVAAALVGARTGKRIAKAYVEA